ncbi:Secretion system C-terminal sorting domain-containing protein [Flavobacterium longum]|uniref:T9SS type A sorting domain-containing protein n=1 Tax=Flavobacterium longum TaxID=1299340 RepID=UPI0039E955A7
MVKKLLLVFFPIVAAAQGYTSYFTGNPTNITTTPEFGVCMMGGATEHDNAMIWLLEKANGGDVVVLRSSGSNGYNDYLYSELGVDVNSVETLVITSVAGATNPYVLDKVANAEMIWFAGGDQWNYVSFFKDNALEDLLNAHVNIKQAPIGGTSAGMAILGGKYYSAQNGTISSTQATNNPFHANMTIGQDDFLQIPLLANVITDTHYDNPDRRGRHAAFLARLKVNNSRVFGIACNEYVAVCIGTDGIARVFGDYPAYEEFAYFIQSNCNLATDSVPEVCAPNTPLTWDFDGQALQVYKVPGTMHGSNFFNITDWNSGSGGSWQDWSVQSASLVGVNAVAPQCELGIADFADDIVLSPVPFRDYFAIAGITGARVSVYDVQGRVVYEKDHDDAISIETSEFPSGLYLISIEKDGKILNKKAVKN